MRHSLGWAALLLAAPAAAQNGPTACDRAEGCVTGLSAPDVFALAERYAGAGKADSAETLLKGLARDPNADYRAEARFRMAILREAQGDRAGAIEWLKRLLDEKPNAARPRLELARLLAMTGDESGARRELRRAGAAGLPEDVARVVDRFALALRSQRKIGGAFEIGVAPDSNINRATTLQTVDTVVAPLVLSPDARAQSGIGASLSGQAFGRVDLSRKTSLLGRISARADLYGKSRFNDVVATVALGPEFQTLGARVRPAAVATRRWFGGARFNDSYGGSLNVLKPLDRTSQIEGELTLLASRFPGISAQNGVLADLNLSWDKAFSPRFSTRVGTRLTRQDARAAFLGNLVNGVDLLASRSFGKQLVFVQGAMTWLRADDTDPLFGVRRRDERLDLTAGVILRRFTFRGLAPLVRVTRTISDSTVPIFDFNRTRFEFALSREF